MLNEEPPLTPRWWLGLGRQQFAWVPPMTLLEQSNDKQRQKHLLVEDTDGTWICMSDLNDTTQLCKRKLLIKNIGANSLKNTDQQKMEDFLYKIEIQECLAPKWN